MGAPERRIGPPQHHHSAAPLHLEPHPVGRGRHDSDRTDGVRPRLVDGDDGVRAWRRRDQRKGLSRRVHHRQLLGPPGEGRGRPHLDQARGNPGQLHRRGRLEAALHPRRRGSPRPPHPPHASRPPGRPPLGHREPPGCGRRDVCGGPRDPAPAGSRSREPRRSARPMPSPRSGAAPRTRYPSRGTAARCGRRRTPGTGRPPAPPVQGPGREGPVAGRRRRHPSCRPARAGAGRSAGGRRGPRPRAGVRPSRQRRAPPPWPATPPGAAPPVSGRSAAAGRPPAERRSSVRPRRRRETAVRAREPPRARPPPTPAA